MVYLLLPQICPSPVLMPVPSAGPLGPFVPAPPKVAMQMLREQGGPSSYDASGRTMLSGPHMGGQAPIIAVNRTFRPDPQKMQSYHDLDAPDAEVTMIDYRSFVLAISLDCLTTTVVNCLATIARKRPQHYGIILSALLDFDPNVQTIKGCHLVSIQYSLRTTFLDFLRCTFSPIIESREKLIRSLRAMSAGGAADQVIRQVDKMIKSGDRFARDARVGKDNKPLTQLLVFGELSRKRPVPSDNEQLANGHEAIPKRICSGLDSDFTSPDQINESERDFSSINGVSPNVPVLENELTAVEQMIAAIVALISEGERGAKSLEILISQIHPDLLADNHSSEADVHLVESFSACSGESVQVQPHKVNSTSSSVSTNGVFFFCTRKL
ncbi:hypothetical protein KIW84_020954 [Lathyrus oleraceus]|uniref:Symplekin/Pta1 N-terminal domain-containing protein n=1 Tax=Pisum sativum TaxID=3888 RepID=A0A9D5B3B9_PEA|nr:hypothetical protein KIW84_020954 [Pisum sativum]